VDTSCSPEPSWEGSSASRRVGSLKPQRGGRDRYRQTPKSPRNDTISWSLAWKLSNTSTTSRNDCQTGNPPLPNDYPSRQSLLQNCTVADAITGKHIPPERPQNAPSTPQNRTCSPSKSPSPAPCQARFFANRPQPIDSKPHTVFSQLMDSPSNLAILKLGTKSAPEPLNLGTSPPTVLFSNF
jgi:hypothetical protein